MRHRIIICVIALLSAVSCRILDPSEEAERVNAEISSLISSFRQEGTSLDRYLSLSEIRNSADSIVRSSGDRFKKKKYDIYRNAVIEISDNPDFKRAWNEMADYNKAELARIPSGTWLVNTDSASVNTIFKLDRKRETIIPYNISGSNSFVFDYDNGLIYADAPEEPVFFSSNDTTGIYGISIPGRFHGRFRKAETADLAMGYYECVPGYNQDYDGYEFIEVGNGHGIFGNTEYEISFSTERFFGQVLKEMTFKDMVTLIMLDKYSRNGCCDCWAIFNGFNFNYRWTRKKMDQAQNILYIFGEPESVWNPETVTLDESAATAVTDSDWDSVLDAYEECVDEYIAMVRKAASGDMTALSDYAEFAEKAQNLNEKIAGAKEGLSPAQQKRYMKILKKMTSAAAKLE